MNYSSRYCASLLGILFCLCQCIVEADVVYAQKPIIAEEELVEAAFILQFIQFIEWPIPASATNSGASGNESSFVIGIVGSSRVGMFLEESAKQRMMADGKPIIVKKIITLDDVEKCQTVYICPTESSKTAQILSRMKNKPILSIGHEEKFMERGGLINLYNENDRLRFEISVEDVANSKLKFSSKLLQLGRIYKRQ